MKKRIILMLFFLSSIITFAQKSKNLPLENSQELIQSGIEAYENKQYERAENFFRSVLFGDSLYYMAQYELALTKYVQEKYVIAAMILEEIPPSSQQVSYKQVFALLANSYDMADSNKKAMELYDKGIEMYPFAYNFYYEKGVAFIKMEKYAEAEKMFRKAIFCSPTHQNSHYYLGLALCQQKQFVPGIMALNYSAMLNATSNTALQALQLISKLYANGLSNYSALDNDEISDEAITKNRQYKPLETFINSNMAIEKKFKQKSDIHHLLTAQNQLVFENLEANSASKAIEDMLYKPLFSHIVASKKTYNVFCYWILQNTDVNNNKVKDKAQTMKKEFQVLIDDILTCLNKSISKGLEQLNNDMIYYYTDQYSLSSFGKINAMEREEGEWTFINNGVTTNRQYAKNGIADGKGYDYDNRGNVIYEYNRKNDTISGEYITYFSQEQKIKRKVTIQNHLYNGNLEEYNFAGILTEKSIWKNDKYNGKLLQYYPKGTPKTDAIYNDGYYAGNSTVWYPNGKVQSSAEVNPDNTITITDYYTNGGIRTIQHKKDTILNKVVWFYHTGEISEEKLYDDNGVLKNNNSYFKNGTVEHTIPYENGKHEGIESYFSPSGKKSADLIWKNDNLEQVITYNNDGSIKEKINKTENIFKVNFYIHDYDNLSFLYMAITLNKQGKKDGICHIYSPQGVLREKKTYKNDVLDGDGYEYYPTGAIKKYAQMKDGLSNGLYIEYHPNGNVKMEEFCKNGTVIGVKYEYDLNGNMTARYDLDEYGNVIHSYDIYQNMILKKSNFTENILMSTENYDETGTLIAQHFLENGIGNNVTYHLNGKPLYIAKITDGDKADTLFEYDINGKLVNYFLFRENSLDGDYKYLSGINNDLIIRGQYSAGELNGKACIYKDGLKLYERDYVANEINGQETSYYINGKIFTVCNYSNDMEDDCIGYAPDGKTVLWKTKYYNGMPYAISVMEKNGKMSDFHFIDSNQITFASYYPNGIMSSKKVYENGFLSNDETYYPNGKICTESKGEQGYLTVSKEYFENGILYSETNWAFDNQQGITRYYYPNGKLKREENWLSDDLDGEVKIYDTNGQLKETQIWFAGRRKQ